MHQINRDGIRALSPCERTGYDDRSETTHRCLTTVERFHIFTRLIYVWQKFVVWSTIISAFDSAATMDGRTAKPLQYSCRIS